MSSQFIKWRRMMEPPDGWQSPEKRKKKRRKKKIDFAPVAGSYTWPPCTIIGTPSTLTTAQPLLERSQRSLRVLPPLPTFVAHCVRVAP